MWRLKSCPRCGGDMWLDSNLAGTWEEQCLQCSYSHEIAKAPVPERVMCRPIDFNRRNSRSSFALLLKTLNVSDGNMVNSRANLVLTNFDRERKQND